MPSCIRLSQEQEVRVCLSLCRDIYADQLAAREALGGIDVDKASAWQQLALTALAGSHEDWCLNRAWVGWRLVAARRQVCASHPQG